MGTVAIVSHQRLLGLVLGLLASAATAWALPGGWTLRFAFTTGWAAVLAYVLVPRGGGGYLIGADTHGYLLLGFGLVLMLAGIITARPLRPPSTSVPTSVPTSAPTSAPEGPGGPAGGSAEVLPGSDQ